MVPFSSRVESRPAAHLAADVLEIPMSHGPTKACHFRPPVPSRGFSESSAPQLIFISDSFGNSLRNRTKEWNGNFRNAASAWQNRNPILVRLSAYGTNTLPELLAFGTDGVGRDGTNTNAELEPGRRHLFSTRPTDPRGRAKSFPQCPGRNDIHPRRPGIRQAFAGTNQFVHAAGVRRNRRNSGSG